MPLVLSIPGFGICLWFSLYQGSEYASGSQYATFTEGPGYALVISEYVWKYLNMREYA